MLPQGHYERSVARKQRCANEIAICTAMGNKTCARVARAEWQTLHTHIKQMEERNAANVKPMPEWGGGSGKIDTQGR